MARASRFHLTLRLLVGLAVMGLGLLLALDELDVLDAEEAFRLWPLLLVAVGLVKLASAPQTGAWVSSLAWIFAGGWQLLYELDVFDTSLLDLWPVILILVGASIVGRAVLPRRSTEDDARVSAFAMMSNLKPRSSSQDFQGGELTAIMGGCEVDLRGARIAGGEAVLDVLAFWGGIEIRVPREWSVVSRVFPLMGGVEDKTDRTRAAPEQRLVVRGYAVMGGVEITN